MVFLRLVNPMKRSDSTKCYFRQRIPQDVLKKARGETLSIPVGDKIVTKPISSKANEVKVSLQTSDRSTAKIRQGIVASYLEAFWQTLRNGEVSLSHKQCVALSGEIYSDWVTSMEDNPGLSELWEKVTLDNELAQQGEYGLAQLMISSPMKTHVSLEERFGLLLDVALAKRGLIVDKETRGRLLEQVSKAMADATTKIKKFSDGDYSEDNIGKRFPKWEEPDNSKQANKSSVSITGIFDGWWREAQVMGIGERTRDSYARTIRYFCDFLGHDDATRVTQDDVIAFKDHRLHEANPKTGKPASPKTVNDSDLAALKSIFNWGQSNNKVTANPAQGVTVKIGKKVRTRPKYFKLEEREVILGLARDYKPVRREGEKLTLAKQWVPWICAYTGARVGEIAQLRKNDIRKEEGHFIFHVTPEAGTVKNKEARDVPIHAHLIELGILKMVEARPEGYLFINVKVGAEPSGPIRTLVNDLGEFIRTVFHDPGIRPNHGWRHTFRTLAREIDGISEKVVDDIVGHAGRTVGDQYGESTIEAKALVMRKFPRLLD